MSDDKDKIIELHEKLEKLDSERDELKRKVARQSTWYKNPAMLTALTGMLAGIGTTAENIASRWEDKQEAKQEEKVQTKTNSAIVEFLVERQDKVENTCMLYADAIMEAMPSYQRRKVDQYISDNGSEGVEVEDVVELAPAPPEPAPSVMVAEKAAPPPKAKKKEKEERLPASSDSLYEMVQRQVQVQESVDFKDLEQIVKKRKSSKK